MTPKNILFEFFSSSKGTPFLKIPALLGNLEKSSYRVSVSLPGVGKIPVARHSMPFGRNRPRSMPFDCSRSRDLEFANNS